mgnify:CR=1 FL=1
MPRISFHVFPDAPLARTSADAAVAAAVHDVSRIDIGRRRALVAGILRTLILRDARCGARGSVYFLAQCDAVLEMAPASVRLFCGVLFWGGCRISEALALRANAFDLGDCIVAFETLKRRRRGIIRQVPLPAELIRQLDVAFELRARHYRLASRQAADGSGRGERSGGDAQGPAPRLRCHRVPERGAAASGAALARPRLARHHRDLRRRVRPGGTRIRRENLVRPAASADGRVLLVTA